MKEIPVFVNIRILALCIARFLQSMGGAMFIPILPMYISVLEDNLPFALPIELKAGILVSLFGLSMTIIQNPIAYLSDRLGRRKILVLGAIIAFSLLSLWISEIQTYLELITLRSLQGICVGITIPLLMVLVSDYSAHENRGKAMGIYSTFHLLGFVVGPLIGGMITDFYGFRAAFYAGGIVGLLCFLFLALFIPEKANPPLSKKEHKEQNQVSLKDQYILGTALFSMMVGITLIIPLFPYYQKRFHASYSEISWIFSALVISRLITQVPAGYLADMYSKRNMMLWGLLFFGPATFCLGLGRSTFDLVLLRLIQGVTATMVMTPAMALGANLAPPKAKGRAMGILGMSFTLGVTLGPVLAGFLLSIHPLLPFLLALILAYLSGVFIYLKIPEKEVLHPTFLETSKPEI